MIVEQMALRLRLPVQFLLKVAATASHRYKSYPIDKKNGGTRTIHHPARELKLLQNWLLNNVLFLLPVHEAATAYRKESSIYKNAERHVQNSYLLRVDFKDFFPSLTGDNVVSVLRNNQLHFLTMPLTEDDIQFIRAIVCRYGFLTIGAPTSPLLSNAIMFPFDHHWVGQCKENDVTYSRYADDLYFSTNKPRILEGILQQVRFYLKGNKFPTLRINEDKTVFTSRKRRRLVTGLVLTPDYKISLGRHKKRMLKSFVFKMINQQLTPVELQSLKGWIAYLRSVEPLFVKSLERKYEVNFATEFLSPEI